MAQMVKRLSAMQETRVQSLGCKDPLEKEMAVHSSILAWKIPWTAEPGRKESDTTERLHSNQNPYKTTGKTIALTRRTFVGNVSAF